ncbi:hypothetical protein KZZ52_33420 [Dactylosporangium sp. AC04546]|uniref:hypothetical protein n=1 Tax=Dactylosporangium sp. AC04546 TaxID=2862460 RepID=UPI001EDDE01C|nr:hypothetical protein [Dactylosporangium sp. AC04546]WVK78879.1 hypothetical protein KZZ52_33420 [Dactylosporangium sp. AC04546]
MKDYGPPRSRAEAEQTVAAHTARDGICEGCLAAWARLTQYPCIHLQWAQALINNDTEKGADPSSR